MNFHASCGEKGPPVRWSGRLCAALMALLCLVLPDRVCQAEGWPLWESYAAKFLDNQGRVIDHGANDVSTSEGEAYALFFALVANDRLRFGKLLDWTEVNMAGGDLTLRLPAWSWGKGQDGSWRVLDPHSASDADLWMAYTLCQAGRLWSSERYTQLGERLASRIAKQELAVVPGVDMTLLPGPEGFHPLPGTWFLNPSYLPPMLLVYFARIQPRAGWSEALQSLPKLLHNGSGFAMDWLKVEDGALKPSAAPAVAQEGNKDAQPLGSYDAIRVYLWLGLAAPQTRAVKESLEQVRGMATYLKGHLTPPESMGPDGRVIGPDAPPGFSAALVPYLQALRLKDIGKAQTDRLQATRDPVSGLYGRDASYYDQNLALFSLGWTESRFRFEADGRLHVAWKR